MIIGTLLFSFLTISLPSHSLSEMAIAGHMQSKLQICVGIAVIFFT